MLEPYNELSIMIDEGMNQAALLRNVHPNEQVRNIADRCEQEFTKISTNLALSRPIYEKLLAVDANQEDTITRRYLRNLLRDMKRAGVSLDEQTRQKIRTLKGQLTEIGQSFNQNIRQDVRTIELRNVKQLAGLPQDYIDAHRPNKHGKITISTDYTDYLPFMTYAQSDKHRLKLYKAFRQRGYPANRDILDQMLSTRYRLAKLLGYDNWASYITEDKMIQSPDKAHDFINTIISLSSRRARRDHTQLLRELRHDYPNAKKVGDWQKTFLEERLKKSQYDIDSQQIRQYFTYNKVRDGVFNITSKMFGVSYTKLDITTWHPHVEAYQIKKDNKLIGQFYLDMHPRANKYKHAAAFPLRTGVTNVQLPQAALVCNFPQNQQPMEHDQVVTFFHEFGHLLHHILGGNHRWVGVSGFNTEWDFVEVPSQLLEEWAWDINALQSFATNSDNEPIPAKLVDKMRNAREFGKGLWVKHQMFYASVSLQYYNQAPVDLDTTKLLRKLQNRISPFKYVKDTYFQYSFGHLDGYSAIYYTYMWSLVIAKDLFSIFQTQGLFDPKIAARYSENILAPGGSKDAATMVHDFLGRDYNFDAFTQWMQM